MADSCGPTCSRIQSPFILFWGFFAVILTLMLILFPSLFSKAEEVDLSTYREHILRYPAMNEEDLYKLVMQGTMGPAHGRLDYEPARRYLEREVEALDSADLEIQAPLLEEIGLRYVRLHLVPYRERRGSFDSLASAFVQSASMVQDTVTFLRDLAALQQEAGKGDFSSIDSTRFAELVQQMRASNLPAIHHSVLYSQTYRPHYRVLHREIALRLLRSQDMNSDSLFASSSQEIHLQDQ